VTGGLGKASLPIFKIGLTKDTQMPDEGKENLDFLPRNPDISSAGQVMVRPIWIMLWAPSGGIPYA
jgi:hypothetical protein